VSSAAAPGLARVDLHGLFQPPPVRLADDRPDYRRGHPGLRGRPGYFGAVFPVVIPDIIKSIVITAENTAPRINDT
jgi:hypothetical protein